MLKNRAGLRDQAQLDQFEAAMVELRLGEPLPGGALDDAHYRALHRHLFADVYVWAGRDRTVRIHKGTSTFCFPEHITAELRRAFRDLAGADHL